MKIFNLVIVIAILLFSCREGNEKQTRSGMKYKVYREMNGKKPHAGDWVTVNMVYSDEKDSILFDSRGYGKPLRFALPEPKFIGSFEEGLMNIGEGDSASFFISADSMFEKVILKEAGGLVSRRPAPGSKLRFDVSLVRVQAFQEAEMEIALDESRQEKAEKNALDAFLKEKNIVTDRQPEGYYLMIQNPGKGKEIKSGEMVAVKFTGRFLNGAVFDSNTESAKPYMFKVGNGEVIRGWDLAFQKLHEGDKVMLIVPSSLGYGGEGLKRSGRLTYIVPPFSTLIFDLEILKMEELSAR